MTIFFFFKYFWFFGIPVGFVNALLFYRRASSNVEPNSEERAEIAKLARGLLFWFCLPSLVMGVLQLVGGHQHPVFFFNLHFQEPTILASWGTLITIWIIMLWWVWLGRGAGTIAKYGRGFNAPSSEVGVKIVTTLCVLAGAAALVFGSILGIGERTEKAVQQTDTPAVQESAPNSPH